MGDLVRFPVERARPPLTIGMATATIRDENGSALQLTLAPSPWGALQIVGMTLYRCHGCGSGLYVEGDGPPASVCDPCGVADWRKAP